jgi:lipid-binding SYLF domain-containing protein
VKITLTPLLIILLLTACTTFSEKYNSTRSQIEDDLAVNLDDGRKTLEMANQIGIRIPKIRADSVAQIVFPKAFKAGLFVGGNYSEGFIFRDGKALGRIRMSGGNLGPQIGGQQYSQVIYVMTKKKFNELLNSNAVKFQGTVSYAKSGESVTSLISTQDELAEAHTIIFNQTGYLAGITMDGVQYSVIEEY